MQEKIALISDVHANLEALKAVLIDIKIHNIKTIYSLGDVIGLGNHPSECLELILENNIFYFLYLSNVLIIYSIWEKNKFYIHIEKSILIVFFFLVTFGKYKKITIH